MKDNLLKYGLKRQIVSVLLILFVFVGLLMSCKSSDLSLDSKQLLVFSTDTLEFETVFSELKSSTQRVIVSNPHKTAIKISRIALLQGAQSPFQINVDGENREDNLFIDVEIPAKDTIFIFVAINPKLAESNSPVFIEDFINFNLSGETQNIALQAIGQNVEILRAKTINNDSTLTGDKPYLIYDSLCIAEDKTLTLAAGCKLYFNNGAKLLIRGNIKAMGTAEHPILMRGHRFDNMNFDTPLPYNFTAGQWNGVYLMGNKGNHSFENVNIRTASVGIILKNEDAEGTLPSVLIKNCHIQNFLFYGLFFKNANTTVVNSEISNTGSYSVYLNGGKHLFVHSTIANYFNSGASSLQVKNREHAHPALMIENSNDKIGISVTFLNSVIAGSRKDELIIKDSHPDKFDAIFSDSYILKSDNHASEWFKNVYFGKEDDKNVFKNTYFEWGKEKKNDYNFEPDSISPIRHLAKSSVIDSTAFLQYNLRSDLNGKSRKEDEKPDAGAYQW